MKNADWILLYNAYRTGGINNLNNLLIWMTHTELKRNSITGHRITTLGFLPNMTGGYSNFNLRSLCVLKHVQQYWYIIMRWKCGDWICSSKVLKVIFVTKSVMRSTNTDSHRFTSIPLYIVLALYLFFFVPYHLVTYYIARSQAIIFYKIKWKTFSGVTVIHDTELSQPSFYVTCLRYFSRIVNILLTEILSHGHFSNRHLSETAFRTYSWQMFHLTYKNIKQLLSFSTCIILIQLKTLTRMVLFDNKCIKK